MRFSPSFLFLAFFLSFFLFFLFPPWAGNEEYLVVLGVDDFYMTIELEFAQAPSPNQVAARIAFNSSQIAGSLRIFVSNNDEEKRKRN